LSDEITIKEAEEFDLDELTALVMRWAHIQNFKPDFNEMKEEIENCMNANSSMFIAKKDNKLVGFINGVIGFQVFAKRKIASENFFFVDPEYRGCGIGKMLVEMYCAWAKILGFS